MTERKKSKLGYWGVIFTCLYFVAVAAFIILTKSFADFESLKLNELGDFIAGVFGPPALIWVVISFYLQSDELRHSVDALNLQAKELQNSVSQQKALVKITEKQLNLDIEVRQEETEAILAKELPLFDLRRGENLAPALSSIVIRRFTLKNIGNAAKTVKYKTMPAGLAISDFNEGYVGFEQEVSFRVRFPDSTNPLKNGGFKLIVTSENLAGKTRIQEFPLSVF